MTAVPPESLVTEGVRSLEVRWIFPDQLETAVARWVRAVPGLDGVTRGRLPAGSAVARAVGEGPRGGALKVKAYRGSAWSPGRSGPFPSAGQRTNRGTRPRAGPAAAVRGGTHLGPHERPALVDPGLRGDRPRRGLRAG
jgi:hypothetical protein